MAEHGDMRVFHGSYDALGHFGLGHGEGRVDARNDIIERGENLIRKIQRSILENVAFGAGEDAKIAVGSVEFRDAGDLRGEALFIEAVCLERCLRVVGDAEVFESEFLCGGDHVFESGAAVARCRVIVECASQVAPLNEVREFMFLGGIDFAPIFAEFRLYGVEIEGAVDVRLLVNLGQGLLEFASLGGTEAVFVERPATGESAGAHADIVLFAAGEIIQCEWKLRTGHSAEVALDAALEDHAGFCGAVSEDIFHKRMGGEECHDGLWLFRGNDEVEVADDFFFPAEAAGDLGEVDIRMSTQVVQESLGNVCDIAEAELAGVAAHVLDAFEDICSGLLAEAGEGGDRAVLAGALPIRHGVDLQSIPEDFDFFCAEALDFKKREDVGRELLAEVVVVVEAAVRGEFGDFFACGFANAFNRHEPFFGDQSLEGLGEGLQRTGGVGVGADFEGILAF